jgi:hypothetical protein
MELVLEAQIPTGRVGESVFVDLEARANEAFEPKYLYIVTKQPSEGNFRQPLSARYSQDTVDMDGLFLVGARVDDGPLFHLASVGEGGLPCCLFIPNGMSAETLFRPVVAGALVGLRIRSERSAIDVRVTLTDTKIEPENQIFPRLSDAFPILPKDVRYQWEYIFHWPSVMMQPGEKRDLEARSDLKADARLTRIVIPSRVGMSFGLWDVRADGESLLTFELKEPQACLTFAEWTAVRRFDLLLRKGCKLSVVIENTSRLPVSFTGACVGWFRL